MAPPRIHRRDAILSYSMLRRNKNQEPGINLWRAEKFPLCLFLGPERGRELGSSWEDLVVGIDSIIIMIIVGAIAGWLAGQLVRGFGFGLLWNIIIGIVGAFIGVWLLTQLGFVPFAGFIGSIVNAVIGAVVLLLIVGFIRR